jgi:flagellar protein FlgJ
MAQVYTDFSGLASLKARAREDRDEALDQVTRQFESLFMQMMLKSMRDASFGGGLLDGERTQFYRDLYDKQLAMHLAERGGVGLADVLHTQLGGRPTEAVAGRGPDDYRAMPVAARPVRPQAPATLPPAAATAQATRPGAREPLDGTPEGFVRSLWPHASEAAGRLGLPPEALLAQAALETGWGRHVIQRPDGSSSHNLFGIKADGRWQGDRARVQTLEYTDGVAVKVRDNFRAYASHADSFRDYVDFLQRNPRYREALQRTDDPAAYFSALQEAGYATDPAYAAKIQRILDGDTLRHAARSMGGHGRAI